MSRTLIVATRKSQLALAQSRAWMRALEAARPDVKCEELHVTTTGDRIQDRALSQIGGKGLFIKEIEEAILAGQAQLAVHSMKDVPAELAPGLEIGCVPLREDPRDVAVTRSGKPLAELPSGAKVGTSSLRRAVQISAWRQDLVIVPLRGNVDTRLRKCQEGEVDAILLARAGLARLGLLDRVTETLEPELVLPAVGQGALAIELASGDDGSRTQVAALDDPDTHVAVAAERGLMLAVDGNCQVPVAAFAQRIDDEMRLRGMLANPDGSQLRRREVVVAWPGSSDEAHRIGLELGRELAGAAVG
ncbi:MAG: hydroxymethylbilane synthase [Polyangiaceae bacterium]